MQLSAFAGFGTFFLFLGFGYFDPFHAFVTVVLFQFLLLMLHSRLAPPTPIPAASLHNDSRWRLGLWGQLLHVAQATAFLVAGTTIALVGVTEVFVPGRSRIHANNRRSAAITGSWSPRLVPLIAHDRTSFGGMIKSLPGCAFWASHSGASARASWLAGLVDTTPGRTCWLRLRHRCAHRRGI